MNFGEDFARHIGFEPQRKEGPFKLFQRDRLIGTVPSFPVRSTSGIFDVRPGDFKLVERGGEQILEATGMMGPGDFACLEGFKRAEGVAAAYDDRSVADDFDRFAGDMRSAAFGKAVEEVLAKAGTGAIERSEAEGQRQLVSNFTALPRRMDRAAADAFGFVFGENVDDLFVNVVPPPGWRLEATTHPMHSDIFDEHGRRRGGVFYKASFYDRNAHGNWSTRYRIEDEYSSEYDTVAVKAVDTATGEVLVSEPVVADENVERWNRADEPQARVVAWLTERYPDYESVTAYWDAPETLT